MLIVRVVLSIVWIALAIWWIRRTLPLAPTAAPGAFRYGTMALASGLAGYALLLTWFGVLRASFGLLALCVFLSIAASTAGIVMLAAARQARRARGERARPIF
jgi:hypothetical protein